ncbi:DegT/DnrJ/EryC1/StrS family aminotransferase [Nocardia suismassiliense]|uniref:DegT/DnrJ/EryC1/StrS family aminotransferase n=1 Tax=Nocardia suismassiliense TaxID=2077092 RepID=UPI000D1D7851|nr:DegT/DnrJ/EryC1/StrS family aminotransferase [Nocardia suismassiliense]
MSDFELLQESAQLVVPFVDMVKLNARVRSDIERSWRLIWMHGQFIDGPEVAEFESEFARYCRVEGCVGVASGTDALQLIFMAMGIGAGDEVIVPANTFIATVEAICSVGARPRFIDVRHDTLLMDAALVEDAINASTAAIVLVHLYGQMVDFFEIVRIAHRLGIAVIEDAAQAHGASLFERRSGSVGDAAAFSFYPAKNLGALGDAGAVVSNDLRLIDRVRSLAHHGRTDSDRSFHSHRGCNSRLDSLQAAVLNVKLRILDQDNFMRSRVMADYREMLPDTCRLLDIHDGSAPVYHIAIIRTVDRRAVIESLNHCKIGWAIHYPTPCHLQPAYSMYGARLPVIEDAAKSILSLPISPLLASREIELVCAALHRVEGRHSFVW